MKKNPFFYFFIFLWLSSPLFSASIELAAPENLSIKKMDEGLYRLEWENSCDAEKTFLIFGLNSKDSNGECQGCDGTFILETNEHFANVDESYVYYSVVTQKGGFYSQASKVVCLLDCDLPNNHFTSIGFQVLSKTSANFYEKHPLCPQDAWNSVQPYLLPHSHPMRRILDSIFLGSQPLTSEKEMEEVGFFNGKERKFSHAVVTGHPRLNGYLVKAYLESHPIDEWDKWISRVKGARLIQECIDKYGYRDLMKVPKKWIYPIPPSSVSRQEMCDQHKYFILLVQDVGIVSQKGNLYQWKHSVTKPLLDAIYTVLTELNLTDSIHTHNIPFSYDGKISFIDTEWFNVHSTKVHVLKLCKHLSNDMKEHLRFLVENGGPVKNP